MARRKTTKKPMAKKRMYRKKRAYRKPMFTASAHLPLGQSQLVRHRYLENHQMTTTAGAPAVYTFRLNALFDPNFTGVGHQPLGFDQMAAIFQAYTVVGARWNLRVWNRDNDEYIAFAYYVSEHGNPTSSGIQGLLEQGALKYVIVPPSTTGGGGIVRNLSGKISVKKFAKVNNILDNDDLRAPNNDNPARPIFLHIVMWQPDGGITNAGGSFYLTLDQIAVWQRPLTLAQS